MALSLELKDILNVGSFLSKFPVCFNLYVLFFLVTPCRIVAVWPCMERILILEKMLYCLILEKLQLINDIF